LCCLYIRLTKGMQKVLIKCFSYYINTFGRLIFLPYLCVGALGFFIYRKASTKVTATFLNKQVFS
jgi:hypothetical protein